MKHYKMEYYEIFFWKQKTVITRKIPSKPKHQNSLSISQTFEWN